MKLFKLQLVLSLSVLLASAVLFTACEPDETDPVPTSLSETLGTFAELSTLLEALDAANLTSQLDGATVTIFAPTNAAFDTFLANAGVASVNDLPIGDLRNVLLNHVLDGFISSFDLTNGYVNTLAEAQGFPASMRVDVDALSLNNSANITSVDIDGLTGVIHVVDQVITVPDIIDLANNDGNLNSLVSDLATVDLVNALQAEGPFTIFAPTDDAIQWATSMNIPLEALEEILSDHVVNGNIRSADLVDGQLIDSFGLDGTSSYTIRFGADGTTQIIETGSNPESIIARITMTDVQGSNGVIHMIDNVIIL